MRFSWTGYDGYSQYGKYIANNTYQPITSKDPMVPMSGKIISYSQDWMLLPFGISAEILPGRRYSGSLWFNAGPVLRFMGQDIHHHLVNTPYNSAYIDYMKSGYSIEPGGSFRFTPHKNVSLELRLSWRSITANPHGKTFGAVTGDNYSGEFHFLSNQSGGLFQALDLGVGLDIRF
jgi:hypothetical protein